MKIPSKKLLDSILGKDTTAINEGVPKEFREDNMLFYQINGDYGVQYTMTDIELLHKMKAWIMDFNNLQGLSTHRPFYTQTDGRKWYAGYSHIHTTYDDKITYNDLGKGDTEFDAVVF